MAGCGDESILKSPVMGREWAKQMKEQLADLEPYQLVPSIFPVPGFFRVWDPKSYSPQLVDLGPIHHSSSRPRLWESDAVKRRFLEQGQRRRRRFNSPAGGNTDDDDDDLRNFTDQVVSPLLPAIRAQYDSHLAVLDSTLASSLALDTLFWVELLLRGSCDDDDDEAAADCASILMNDAVMLENQIPLFLLQEPLSALLQGRHSGSESGLFDEQLERVYHRLSPLQFLGSPNHNHPRHLLEYLYFQIVGFGVHDQEEDSSTSNTTTAASFLQILEMAPPGVLKKVPSSTAIEFDILDLLSDAFQAAGAKILKRAGMYWLAWIMLEVIRFLRRILLDVEASIPAASLLAQHLDLTILPADGGSSLGAMVSFDEQKRTLRVPVLTLKPNCGTLLRNLVAYEYMTRSDDARVLIGYLKLIAGLTKTVEDMSLLRRARVIDAEGSDLSALKLFSSQIPPVFLTMIKLHGLAHESAMEEVKDEAEELEAAMNEVKAAAMETGAKLEAMVAAKDAAAAGTTALDSQIQALNHCYDREPEIVALKRKLRRMQFAFKIVVVAFLIDVAGLCAYAITEAVYKYVTLDCLYQWPCCPQGLFSALVTLVTGGFILNLVRALL